MPSPRSDLVWHYDRPVISTLYPKLLPALGGAELNISGSNFGLNGTVFVGSRECVVTAWSHVLVRCVSPRGASPAAGVIVTVSGQSNVLSSLVSSASPDRVAYMRPVVLSVNVTALSSAGGEAVLVIGSQFGESLVSVWFTREPAAILESNPAVLMNGNSLRCDVLSSSSSLIQCVSPAGGGVSWSAVVVNHDVSVGSLGFAGVLVSTDSSASVRYHAPVITSIGLNSTAWAVAGGAPAVGGFLVRLTGMNFTAAPIVSVTGVVCDVVEGNHTALVFVAPPRRVDVDMVVIVEGFEQVSGGVLLVYDPPVVFRSVPNVFDAIAGTGRPSLLLVGVNFGLKLSGVAASHVVSIGDVPCLFSDWRNDTAIGCVPAGDFVAGAYNVSVAVRGQASVWTPGGVVWAECQFGYFGPSCARCPEGGVCPGRGAVPYAQQGYFGGVNASFVRCQPVVACVGGVLNQCAPQYTGDLCGTCAVAHYRCVSGVAMYFVGL